MEKIILIAIGACLTALAHFLPPNVYGLNTPERTGVESSVQGSTLRIVDNASEIPGLTDRVREMLGRHFFLDNLPDNARTLEAGYDYLMNKTTSQRIRETLNAWKETYGAELQIQHEGKSITVLLWGESTDFKGRLIYAVSSSNGYPWQVYLEPAWK